MNKYILYASSFSMLLASYYLAAEVPIYITAKVVEKACTITSDSIVVDMGIANSKGAKVGIPFSPLVPFKISLSDCPTGTMQAHVTLSTSNSTSHFIENDSIESSKAKGYAIAVYNSANEIIDMQDNMTDFMIDHNSLYTDLNFSAAFVKTNNDASAGIFHAVASFEIDYD
ncbi:fimbrial protein [Orbus sturtevantii]|uniref:fimbrial protein n=1 Tax=Orbus sturtevantii TaxID=3074109 RepID=UPI00370D4DFB